MIDEKMDFLDAQKKAMETGVLRDDVYDKDLLKKISEKLLILRFGKDNFGTKIVSNYHGRIVFADRCGKFTPEEGDTWACTITEDKGTSVVVTLLIKITPVLLLKLDDPTKADIEKALWETNRKAYEKKFEELYKAELFGQIKASLEEEYASQILERDNTIALLNAELDVLRALNKQREFDEKFGTLASKKEITYTEEKPSVNEPIALVELPSANQSMAPGLPDVNINEMNLNVAPGSRFHVKCHEGTIKSESFSDGHYFVHMAPNREFIVVRPHFSGGALCINHAINVKALREIFLKYEGMELVCDYNSRYHGLIVYLNRPIAATVVVKPAELKYE